VLHFNEFL